VKALELRYSILPPTENGIRQIRWIRQGGKSKAAGMCYTPEAENYRKQFREFVRTNYFVAIQKFRREHKPFHVYTLHMFFYFPAEEILNKGWLTQGKSRAKSPYKKMDVGNRRKLLEDCFSESIDVDDSLFFGVQQYKFVAQEPRVELLLEREDPSAFGIPEEWLIE
jgi:Holliday junction resolvase RusA-like endonuclease